MPDNSMTTSTVQPSSRRGMGTMLYPGGAGFRVWAPFATRVGVAGSFNGWSPTAHPFASEGNGYWSADVPGVNVGDEYQFVIVNGAQPLIWHKNPYASSVVNSSGNAVVHDPSFDWTGDRFTMSELPGSLPWKPSISAKGAPHTSLGRSPRNRHGSNSARAEGPIHGCAIAMNVGLRTRIDRAFSAWGSCAWSPRPLA